LLTKLAWPVGPNQPSGHAVKRHDVCPDISCTMPEGHGRHVAAAALAAPVTPKLPAGQVVPRHAVWPVVSV
jgi:hypothetical protein